MQNQVALLPTTGVPYGMPGLASPFFPSDIGVDDAYAAAELRPEEITLRRLETVEDIEQVLHLREHIDLAIHNVLDPLFEAHEKLRDERGFVGAFEWRGVVIGTIRVVPMGWGLTLTEELLAGLAPDTAPPADPHGWEVGRLVLLPEYRTNYDALRRCLFLSVSYLHEHARVTGLYASCSHALSRLYRRFGFAVLAQDVVLPGTAKSYTLIRSESERVIAALSPRTTQN